MHQSFSIFPFDPPGDSAALRAQVRAFLAQHRAKLGVPNCWVVADTTKKTIQIYRGTEPRAVPDTLKFRLLAALEARMKARHKTD